MPDEYTNDNDMKTSDEASSVKQPKFAASPPNSLPSSLKVILGWLVHLYTATGVVVNFYNIYYSFIAGRDFHLFCRLNWLAIFIDATDGTLARAVDIKKTIPSYDGALLDNIIDFITFSVLPSLSVIHFDIVPEPYSHLLSICILISSCYAFCQTLAKTDSAFVGFPSYWNIVVFYMYYLKLSTGTSIATVLVCTITSFVPVHFIYPTRTKEYQATTLVGAYIWGAAMLFVAMFPDNQHVQNILYVSLLYVVYYIAMSLHLDRKRRKNEALLRDDASTTEQSQSLHTN